MDDYILITVFVVIVLLFAKREKRQPQKEIKAEKLGKPSLTMRGEYVRSKGEKRIADWLHAMNIRYKYEPKLSNYVPDFYLPDHNLIIEYYGLRDAEGSVGVAYRKKILDKRKYFDNLSVRLVELYPEDLSYLNQILSRKLLARSRTGTTAARS